MMEARLPTAAERVEIRSADPKRGTELWINGEKVQRLRDVQFRHTATDRFDLTAEVLEEHGGSTWFVLYHYRGGRLEGVTHNLAARGPVGITETGERVRVGG